jgi:hypothetical protein
MYTKGWYAKFHESSFKNENLATDPILELTAANSSGSIFIKISEGCQNLTKDH